MPIWAQKRSPENYSSRIARYITIKLTLQKRIFKRDNYTRVFFLIVGREIMENIETFVCFKNVLNKLK